MTLELGHRCDSDHQCSKGLECRCVALNRGLRTCAAIPGSALNQTSVAKSAWERQGLTCEPRLPIGAVPMTTPPPSLRTDGVVNPTEQTSPQLRAWSALYPWYKQYGSAYLEENPAVCVPVLAGDDVGRGVVEDVVSVVSHLVIQSLRPEVFQQLAKANVRVLVAASAHKWLNHPEVKHDFESGLGGGAPWFPSTGIAADELENLPEELLHTIQYVAMPPRFVCMYHRAYDLAFTSGLYTTDHSGEEVDGEPVPTLQADEYVAMALNRWLGLGHARDEYTVAPGRASLLASDSAAFCLLAQYFDSLDPWSLPGRPPNEPVPIPPSCEQTLAELAKGCPVAGLTWPYLEPNWSLSHGTVHDFRVQARAVSHALAEAVVFAALMLLALGLALWAAGKGWLRRQGKTYHALSAAPAGEDSAFVFEAATKSVGAPLQIEGRGRETRRGPGARAGKRARRPLGWLSAARRSAGVSGGRGDRSSRRPDEKGEGPGMLRSEPANVVLGARTMA
mmetsp:Transcript_9188/g.24082  ORF Transcript_9188/g.24082 Transcript_9188/m.24082 type:complete len:506 (-) Transcript_9188:73-1590(-)